MAGERDVERVTREKRSWLVTVALPGAVHIESLAPGDVDWYRRADDFEVLEVVPSAALEASEARAGAAEAALEFYADRDLYKRPQPWVAAPCHGDFGARAREALAELRRRRTDGV